MSKKTSALISGLILVVVLIIGYVYLLSTTKPQQALSPQPKDTVSLRKDLLRSKQINDILKRKPIGSLPVQPPDSSTDNPFKSLE